MLDFPLTAFLNFNLIEWVILLILVAPTIYVMLSGAPFVPTQMKQVQRMLSAMPLKKGMKLYDLGSGDGRLVHTAARDYEVDAVGYEYSPFVFLWAKFLSLFWKSTAKLRFGNLWKQDLSDADVIVCYLLPEAMKRLHKEIWPTLKPGTLLVSHAFAMHDEEVFKKLPREREKKLGPIWIYKKSAKKAPLKQDTKKTKASQTKKTP